jgi:HSP20 family protein
MAEKDTAVAPRRSDERMTRSQPSAFGVMQRFADEIDRIFDDFGFGSFGLSPRFGRRSSTSPWWRGSQGQWDVWDPDVEVFQRGNEIVVRADLPGMKRDNVKIEVTEDGITIQGERRREEKEEREGFYRSERSYGTFTRFIPLPEGAMTDQAKAHFKDGVLEITVPAPPEQVRRGRRIEISEGEPQKK